jgi:hypothetical protein
MSRFDDLDELLDETPSSQATSRVVNAVAPELHANRERFEKAKAQKRRSFFGVLGLGAATAAAVVLWSRQNRNQEENLSLAGFAEIESEDLDLLADLEDEDLMDLLESLDSEDKWEES